MSKHDITYAKLQYNFWLNFAPYPPQVIHEIHECSAIYNNYIVFFCRSIQLMSDTVTTVILSEWLVDEALSRPFNLIMWFIV